MRVSLCYELISSAERNKHTARGRSTQFTNNSDPIASTSEFLLRQNSVTAHFRRLASVHCATENHRPESADRPVHCLCLIPGIFDTQWREREHCVACCLPCPAPLPRIAGIIRTCKEIPGSGFTSLLARSGVFFRSHTFLMNSTIWKVAFNLENLSFYSDVSASLSLSDTLNRPQLESQTVVKLGINDMPSDVISLSLSLSQTYDSQKTRSEMFLHASVSCHSHKPTDRFRPNCHTSPQE
jgi:hypothetical protein